MAPHSKKLWFSLWLISAMPVYSAGIQNLTFTEVVKDVIVIDVATKKESTAKSGDVLVPPNVLKTGPDSRAELVAEDKTVTRVGANTIFSVEADSRDVNLEQGSVLFNSPKGRGGGRIKSAGATASVLGTTIQVGANAGAGGMKVMVMEGKAALAGAKGGATTLNPGQLSFVQAGKPPSAPLNFDLKANISSNKLVGGFNKPLASITKIEAAVNVQQAKISSGALGNTGLLIGDRPEAAFKLDVASLQSVITQVLEQIKAATEAKTASRSQVDPRYIAAVAKSVNLVNQNFTPAESVFSIDGSGVSPEGYSLPSTIPGDRQRAGTMSALIAAEISLSLEASASPLKVSSFLNSQLDQTLASSTDSPPLKFDAGAILALTDINLSGNISLEGLQDVRTVPSITGAATTKDSKTVSYSTAYGLEVGMTVSGTGIPDGSKIVSINSANNTLVLSTTATDTATGLELVAVVPNAAAVLGSNQVTVSSQSSVGLVVGMKISANSFFPSDTTITEISSDGTRLTLSSSALQDGAATLTVLGFQSGIPILLSAGRTLNIAPGTTLRADTSLLEIYAAGLSFSGDVSLSEVSGTSKTPLVLDSVKLVNGWATSDGTVVDGMIRIKAPSIDLIDTGIQAGQVVLEADGAIRLVSHDYLGLQSSTPHTSHTLVSLGFEDPSDLKIQGFSFKITSNQSSVTIGNIGFYANETFLSAPNDVLTLSGVTHDPFDDQIASKLNASAKSILVNNASFPSLTETTFSSNFGNIAISGDAPTSTEGDLGLWEADKLSKTQFGSVATLSAETDPRSSFRATSLGGLEMTNAVVRADLVELTSVQDMTVSSVYDYLFQPTDSLKVDATALTGALFSAISTRGNVTITGMNASAIPQYISHGAVKITAGGAVLDSVETAKVSSLRVLADAKDKEINLQSINFKNAQAVALDAATIILSNVSFAAGSTVTLNSFRGMVARNPGVASTAQAPVTIRRGYVNIRENVAYGDYVINFSSETDLNQAAFRTAIKADSDRVGKTLDETKFNIGTQKGNLP